MSRLSTLHPPVYPIWPARYKRQRSLPPWIRPIDPPPGAKKDVLGRNECSFQGMSHWLPGMSRPGKPPSRPGKAADHPLPSAGHSRKAAGRWGMAAGRSRKAADDLLRAADRARKAADRSLKAGECQPPTRGSAAPSVLSAVAGLHGSVLLIEGKAASAASVCSAVKYPGHGASFSFQLSAFSFRLMADG